MMFHRPSTVRSVALRALMAAEVLHGEEIAWLDLSHVAAVDMGQQGAAVDPAVSTASATIPGGHNPATEVVGLQCPSRMRVCRRSPAAPGCRCGSCQWTPRFHRWRQRCGIKVDLADEARSAPF